MEHEIFQVGLTLSVESYYKTHLTTLVLGWEKDAFILAKAIYVQGQPAKISTNDLCKIRFLKDGIAYGFETEVVAVQFFPYPLMFLKYPGNVQCLKLRVAPRFKANLATKFSDAAGVHLSDAVMLDISEGGCGLQVPVQEGKELSPEAGYSIAFKLLDREITIGCVVRKLDKGKDVYFLGMEFSNVTAQNKETLAMFLDFLKKHTSA